MHPEARDFIGNAVKGYEREPVLEIGSRDVNGSIHSLFTGEYLGIDRVPGPGVDLVIEARDYDGEEYYGLCVSAEALEHAYLPMDIIACAARALRPGGLFVITCAGPDRPVHGANGGALEPGEPYQAITGAWIGEALECWGFGLYTMTYNAERGDLYLIARKDER